LLPAGACGGRIGAAMKRDRKQPAGAGQVSAEQMLRAVPHQNTAMTTTRRSDGTALVSVPIRRPKYMVPPLSWFLPFSSHRRVELDRVGVRVLELCNGRRTVESIIEKFAGEHKLSFREAQLSISQFLSQLTQRGLIAIVGKKKDSEQR